jgi:hypothetical protein
VNGKDISFDANVGSPEWNDYNRVFVWATELPTASIDALSALAHAEKNSSDEAGEFFSMAAAVKVPAAQPENLVR